MDEQQGAQDRRIRKTKTAIHQALMDLLLEKPISQISIVELTTRADVNRKTFYNHYNDLYDVLSEVEDELTARLQRFLENRVLSENEKTPQTAQLEERINAAAYPFFLLLMKQLKTHPGYYTMIQHCEGRTNVIPKMVACAKGFFQRVVGEDVVDGKTIDYLMTFFVNGVFSVISKWAEEGFREPVTDMAHFFKDLLSSGGIHGVLLRAGQDK